MTDKQYLKYIVQNNLYDFTNKSNYMFEHIAYSLNRLSEMFRLNGIEEVPGLKHHEREVKLMLLAKGFGAINLKPINDKYYMQTGGLGGEPDAYYQPTLFTYANPALNISGQWKIHEDCVVVRNDSNYMGILPLLIRYGSLLAETELSMYNAVIDTRSQMAAVAANDKIKDAIDKYFDDRVKGKISSIVGNGFLDDENKGVASIPLKTSASEKPLEALVEFNQYLKASENNDLGLNANYNMKREALNSAESALNDDILFPLVDNIQWNWQYGFDEFNEATGYNIQVEFNSSWEDNKKEEQAELNNLDPVNGGENPPEAEEKEEETPEEKEPETPEDEPEEKEGE